MAKTLRRSGVKIVATIGPKTNTRGGLESLLEAGMDVARLNGSHSDLEWHANAVALLRSVAPGVPILLDIPGRKIRTRQLATEPSFNAGDRIVLTTSEGEDGSVKVPVNRADLHEYLRAGDAVLADDGTLRFTVTEVDGRDIVCRAETAGTLRSAKGINVPSANIKNGPITERDIAMLAFARKQGVDFVGISFVDSASVIEEVRGRIGPDGPRVLAKVENEGAMNNLDEVIEAADAIMIDRGDLSVETNLETIALFQKRILKVARRHNKPVIVATEMLHSMIENVFPTKAEVSDISNAVLDGAAALMLSGETAIGKFPAQAVSLMRLVADTVDGSTHAEADEFPSLGVPQAMGEAIALLCQRLPITKIVAVTKSGYAARMVANFRPRQPIIAVSNSKPTARSLNLLYGTEGVFVDLPFSRTSTDHVVLCLEELWKRGKITDADVVLVTSVGYPRSGNRMNMIQSHLVSDLRESLSWTR
jgi:pyruvate kinase